MTSTNKVNLVILSGNKSSLLFRSLIEILSDLMKDYIVGDIEWPLKVVSDTVNGFDCLLYLKN